MSIEMQPLEQKIGMDIISCASVMMIQDKKQFYAVLLQQLNRYREELKTPDGMEPMAGTNIKNGVMQIFYNPMKLCKLSKEELLLVLEHELLHFIWYHMYRMQDCQHDIANIAMDLAINSFFPQRLCEEMGILHPENDAYKFPIEKSSEWYYDELVHNAKTDLHYYSPDSENSKDGMGASIGTHSKWKENTTEQGALNEAVLTNAVRMAYEEHQKAHGVLPAGVERYIQELLAPATVPWQKELKNAIGATIEEGSISTWKREHRIFRDLFQGEITDHKLKIIIAIDTSGSISEGDYQEFMIEIEGIKRIYRADIEIIECDADVQKYYKMRRYSDLDINFKGGGGTDFRPVFEYIDENRLKPEMLIFFTDLEGTYPEPEAHRFKTLWVACSGASSYSERYHDDIPFGKLIVIKD